MLATLNARQSLTGNHGVEFKEYASSSVPRSLPLSTMRFKDSPTRFKESGTTLQVSKTSEIHISTNSDLDHVRVINSRSKRVTYNFVQEAQKISVTLDHDGRI